MKLSLQSADLTRFIYNYTKDFSDDNFIKTTFGEFRSSTEFHSQAQKKSLGLKSELHKTLNYGNELKYSLIKKKNPRTTLSNLNDYISKIKKNSQSAMRRKSQIFSLQTSVFSIIDVKIKTMNFILKRDKPSSIESINFTMTLEVNDILEIALYVNDKNVLIEGINLIGEIQFMFGDISSTLFTFNHMRILSEALGLNVFKVRSLIMMAEACKRAQRFKEAKIFLKKGLQYVWHYGFADLECSIYDHFGVLYYYTGDLEMAKFFHDRSVNFDLESANSPSKKFSEDNFRKMEEGIWKVSKIFKNINKSFLIRFVLSLPYQLANASTTDIKDPNFLEEKPKKTDLKRNGFSYQTDLSIETLLDSILTGPEFLFEIGTPILGSNQNFGKKKANGNGEFPLFSRRNFSESQINIDKLAMNEFCKYKKVHNKFLNTQKATPKLPAALKKLPIEQILDERKKEIEDFRKQCFTNQSSKRPTVHQNGKKIKPQSWILQLSRNRNIEQFEHSCNVNINLIQRRFDKLIHYFSEKVVCT